MKTQLRNHIVKLIPTFEKEIDNVHHYFEKQSFPKNQIIITEGKRADNFYFVLKGCMHIYFTDNDGKHNTIHFAIENWWITEYNSFLTDSHSNFNLATLEDTEVLRINKENFEQLLLEFPFMAIYFNKINIRAYGAALQKQKTFATTSKKDFHSYFCTTYPDLVKRFPDNVFASYIGISVDKLKVFNDEFGS